MARQKPLAELSPAYRKRLENYLRRHPGAARSHARGHLREREEKQARRIRIKEQFGVTPERLVQLRRTAVAHMRMELPPGATASRPDFDLMADRLKSFSGPMLEIVIDTDRDTIRQYAHLSYEELIETFPEAENDEHYNPFWYH